MYIHTYWSSYLNINTPNSWQHNFLSLCESHVITFSVLAHSDSRTMNLKWTQQGISNLFLPWLTVHPQLWSLWLSFISSFIKFKFLDPHIETTVWTVFVQCYKMNKQQKPLNQFHRVTFISGIWRVGTESLCGIGGAMPANIFFGPKCSVTHSYCQSMTCWCSFLSTEVYSIDCCSAQINWLWHQDLFIILYNI